MSKLVDKYNELNSKIDKSHQEMALELALNNLLIKVYEIDTKIFINYYDSTIKILEDDLINIKNNIEINKIAYNHNIELLLYLNEINEIKLLKNINQIKEFGENFKETIKNIETILTLEKENSILKDLNLDLKKMNEIVSLILSIRTK